MKWLLVPAMFSAVACATEKEKFEVSKDTVQPASHIDWLGHDTELGGEGKLKVGEPLPAIMMTGPSGQREEFASTGKVRVISVIPSIDTEVCDRQTHILNSSHVNKDVERITVSRDLPYAQRRFAEASKTEAIKYISDYRGGDFGHKLGLEIERNGLLARAIIVVDRKGIVRHVQITPKIYTLPDMDKAIDLANRL